MFEHSKEEEGRNLVKVKENLVASNADTFKNGLTQILQEGAEQLTIDIGEVRSIDSRGLSVLIAAHNSLQKKGNNLQIVNANDDIRKLLHAMRLDQHFEILA